jgi:hypothetical protein
MSRVSLVLANGDEFGAHGLLRRSSLARLRDDGQHRAHPSGRKVAELLNEVTPRRERISFVPRS